MPRPLRRDPIFRYRRHEEEIIVLAVRWYISYRLSLRELTGMLEERGLVDYPSTIWRRVQRYVPEFEKRWDILRRRTGSSWRVDETTVQIRGRWHYLARWQEVLKQVDGGHTYLPDEFYLKKSVPLEGVGHQNGTCRFGTDARSSGLNLECRTLDIHNLY